MSERQVVAVSGFYELGLFSRNKVNLHFISLINENLVISQSEISLIFHMFPIIVSLNQAKRLANAPISNN